MSAFSGIVAAICAAVLVEEILPQRAIYHAGWYNVMLLALVVLLVAQARSRVRAARRQSAVAVAAIALGAGVIGFSGMVNGLLAPDPQTVIGAPGQEIAVSDLGGDLLFPRLDTGSNDAAPELLRRGRRPLPIDATRHLASFILRPVPRTVVRVEAHDLSGAHLTITQPEGSAFLSPVLLMQQTQRISGLDLPYDSFALPAAHRIVKAVLFNEQQIAALRGITGPPVPAVLFAVDNDADQPLPHAIVLARSGESVRVGGLFLRADVVAYPEVDVIAVPSIPASAIGAVLIVLGLVLASRMKAPPHSSRGRDI